MSNRFAAGPGDAGRRRRRLATVGEGEAGTPSPPDPAPPASPRRLFSLHRPVASEEFDTPALPLARLIPRHPLWYALLACLLALGVAGLHTAALRTEACRAQLSPGVARLVDPRLSVVGGGATALLCLGAAQLLLLVGWTRAHSDRDYAGRYRKWFRLALQLGLLGLLVGVQGYRSLGQAAPQLLPETVWKRDVLVWFAPLAAWLLAGTVSACLELRRAPGPLLCLLLSTLASLAAGVLALQVLALPGEFDRLAWQQTLFLASGAGVFLAAGLALRHVLYVSLDPPVSAKPADVIPEPHFAVDESAAARPRRATGTRRRSTGKKRAKTKRTRRAASSSPTDTDAETDEEASTDDEWSDEESSTTDDFADDATEDSLEDSLDESAAEDASEASDDDPAPDEDDWNEAPQSSPAHSASRSYPSESHSSAPDRASSAADDEEDSEDDDGTGADADSLRGLSKKERRRLRQQQRDRERQSGRR